MRFTIQEPCFRKAKDNKGEGKFRVREGPSSNGLIHPPCLRPVNSDMQKAGATQLSWLLAPEESFTKAGGMTLAGPAGLLVSRDL